MDCRLIWPEDGATRLVPGNDDKNRSRDAMRPSFVNHHAIKESSPPQKGGEAPKAAMPTIAAQHQQTSASVDVPQTSVRSLRHSSATRLRAIFGGRSPSGASTAALQGLPPLLNSRPCFLGLGQRMIRKSGYRFSEKIMRS